MTTATKTNHYLKVLAILAVSAIAAASVVVYPVASAHAATTLTVNSTSDAADTDSSDGECFAFKDLFGFDKCTLRAAIEQANATPGADTIDFDVPNTSASEVKTIKPASELPRITEAVTIDGYTQPGSSPNTLAKGTDAKLLIELDGTDAGFSADGLGISASNVTIRGLVINRFGHDGINTESLNLTHDIRIAGNFIGTDPSGTVDLGNGGMGLRIEDTSNAYVGGTTPPARNLVSGNGSDGVVVFFSTGVKVEGNLVGTEKDGVKPLGNGDDGVQVSFDASGNFVGTTLAGAANTIAFNGGNGVRISGGNNNAVVFNSIFSNGSLGIDLGPDGRTANDPDDADVGPNGLQNFPVLSSAEIISGETTIKGSLNSTPNTDFRINFYSTPGGENAEGKTSLGGIRVTTDADGDATFTNNVSQAVPVGENITATARPEGGQDTDNTSEFSAPRSVVAADTTAPTVTSVLPASNATGVARTANVRATFSEAMKASTINATTFKLKRAGTTTLMPAAVSLDAATKRATLNPNADLRAGATYVATVTIGATDLADNHLDQNPSKAGNQKKIWRFRLGQ